MKERIQGIVLAVLMLCLVSIGGAQIAYGPGVVDFSATAGLTDSSKVAKAGDTMTGALHGTTLSMTGRIDGTSAAFTGKTSATQYTSTIATGTAPLVCASTTRVANLNADMLDGYEGASFSRLAATSQTFTGYVIDGSSMKVNGYATLAGGATISSAFLTSTQITSSLATGVSPLSVVSTTLNTNLNADLVDGVHGTAMALAANTADHTTGAFTCYFKSSGSTGLDAPAGTVVHNQTEMTALLATLGKASLKTVQGCYNILPPFVEHSIIMEGVYEGSPAVYSPPVGAAYWLTIPNTRTNTGNGSIQIRCVNDGSWHVAAVAGTWAGATFTRTTGTWATGALVGHRAIISSMASTPYLYVIANDATTLRVSGRYADSGAEAATVGTYDNGAYAVAGSTGGITGGYDSNVQTSIQLIDFGTSSVPFKTINTGNYVTILRGRIYSGATYAVDITGDDTVPQHPVFYLYESALIGNGNYGVRATGSNANLTLYSAALLGTYTSDISHGLVTANKGARVYFYNSILSPTTNIGAWEVVAESSLLSFSSSTIICPTAGTYGIYLQQMHLGDPPMVYPNHVAISGCGMALDILGARVTEEYSSTAWTDEHGTAGSANSVGLLLESGAVYSGDLLQNLGGPTNNELWIDGLQYGLDELLYKGGCSGSCSTGDSIRGIGGSVYLYQDNG